MRNMKILGIGESVIDNVSLAGEEQIAHRKHIGGPVPTALIFLSRLGLSCTLLTSLGKDEDGKIIRHTLKHEGVSVLAKLQHKTKVNTIHINRQTGQRQKLRGDTVHRNIKNLKREFIRQFDIILIDRHEREAFYEIVAKKKESAKLLIDPSTEVSPFTLDMMRFSEYPIIPIETLMKVREEKNILACLKKVHGICNKTVIVTAGEMGSILYNGNDLELVPAVDIRTVDTTGAGDIYRGAFAYGIVQGWSMAKCAQFANLAGGLQCTKIGNAAAIPTKSEIEAYNEMLQPKKAISVPIINTYFEQLYQTV